MPAALLFAYPANQGIIGDGVNVYTESTLFTGWTHICVVYSSTTWTIYKDGVPMPVFMWTTSEDIEQTGSTFTKIGGVDGSYDNPVGSNGAVSSILADGSASGHARLCLGATNTDPSCSSGAMLGKSFFSLLA